MISSTEEVVDRLYGAFLAGDGDGRLELLADDAHVRFLGQVELRGRDAFADNLAFAAV